MQIPTAKLLVLILLVHCIGGQQRQAQAELVGFGTEVNPTTWVCTDPSHLLLAAWTSNITRAIINGTIIMSAIDSLLNFTGGPVLRTANLTIEGATPEATVDLYYQQNLFRLAANVAITFKSVTLRRYDPPDGSLFGLAASPGAAVVLQQARLRQNVIGPGVPYLGPASVPALPSRNNTLFCSRNQPCDYAYALPSLQTTLRQPGSSRSLRVVSSQSHVIAARATWNTCTDAATYTTCAQQLVETSNNATMVVDRNATSFSATNPPITSVWAFDINAVLDAFQNDSIDKIWITHDSLYFNPILELYQNSPYMRTRPLEISGAAPPDKLPLLKVAFANRLFWSKGSVLKFRNLLIDWVNLLTVAPPFIPQNGPPQQTVFENCLYTIHGCPSIEVPPAVPVKNGIGRLPYLLTGPLCYDHPIAVTPSMMSQDVDGSLAKFPDRYTDTCYAQNWAAELVNNPWFNSFGTNLTLINCHLLCDRFVSSECQQLYDANATVRQPCVLRESTLMQDLLTSYIVPNVFPSIPPPYAPPSPSPPPYDSSADQAGSKLRPGGLAAICVAAGVVAAGMLGYICLWQPEWAGDPWKRNKREAMTMEGRSVPVCIKNLLVIDPVKTTNSWRRSASHDTPVPITTQQPEECMAQLYKRIGTGSTGQVFHSRVKGVHVAMKIFGSGQDVVSSFISEWHAHANLYHPHIVRLLGYSLDTEMMGIMTELCSGSLDQLLYPADTQQNRSILATVAREEAKMRPLPECDTAQLPVELVLALAMQMAQALEYMHKRFIHMDLKPQNVLLKVRAWNKYSHLASRREGVAASLWTSYSVLGNKHRLLVKLADFGLGTSATRGRSTRANLGGSFAYMSPERIGLTWHSAITTKADIYSFGIILWEMLHRQKPWAGLDTSLIVTQVCRKRKRPAFTRPCPPGLRELIQSCWAHHPQDRPDASEVIAELQKVYNAIIAEKQAAAKPGGGGEKPGADDKMNDTAMEELSHDLEVWEDRAAQITQTQTQTQVQVPGVVNKDMTLTDDEILALMANGKRWKVGELERAIARLVQSNPELAKHALAVKLQREKETAKKAAEAEAAEATKAAQAAVPQASMGASSDIGAGAAAAVPRGMVLVMVPGAEEQQQQQAADPAAGPSGSHVIPASDIGNVPGQQLAGALHDSVQSDSGRHQVKPETPANTSEIQPCDEPLR